MGVKPIDLQVNISQINHVARIQHNEQGHFREVQLKQADHLAKESEAKAQTIQQTLESTNEESLVKERKESLPQQHHAQHGEHERDEGDDEEMPEDVFDTKGHLFDGFS